MQSKPRHRPEIDGLRAIAVLSVIFYHYLPAAFPGGFAGVDVFFVISGFLITEHIASEIAANRFSLLAFYERRIRRIVPAFALMYGLVLLGSAAILFPRDWHFDSRVAAYVIPFLGNYALYQNAGAYGGELASRIALLHTWSLAVEEQFYLFFPLLMLGIQRLARGRYSTVLWILTLVSFALCVAGVRVAPLATFYLPQFRAWELLLGALLAVGRFSPPGNRHVRAVTTVSGLLLIAAADLLLSPTTPNPSEYTLLPCIGAVAILYAASDKTMPAGGLLDNRIMRRIGLWSYSLYLAHWPLLVLAEYYAFDPLSPLARGVLLAATFAIGALSWRYVEQPFRGPGAVLSQAALYAVAAAVALVLLSATVAAYHWSDPRRYGPADRAIFPTDTPRQLQCRNTSPEGTQKPPCRLGDRDAPVEAIFWGDSHALAFLPAVDAAYAKHRQAIMFAQQGGCPALVDVHIRDAFPKQSRLLHSWLDSRGLGRSEYCKRHTEAVLDWIARNHIRTVILAGHWIAYTENHHPIRLTDPESPDNEFKLDNAAVFARGLDRLLEVLDRGHVRVFVLEDAPQNHVDVPYALASARRLRLDRDFRMTRAEYAAQQRSATDIFERLQKRHGFQILRPQELLCADGRCAIERGGVSLYVDEEHLSAAGAIACEAALDPIWKFWEKIPKIQ